MIDKDFYKTPLTYQKLEEAIFLLAKDFPSLKVFPIGKSVLNKNIHALSIGNPMGATLFVGGTHGLEWLTTMLLIKFCENILVGMHNKTTVSDIDVCRALSNRSLVIIPCLNPDGIDISVKGKAAAEHLADKVETISKGDYSLWQANANGVDINHNFDAGWFILKEMEILNGINGPAPTRYGGTHPHSEPETRAIVNFCMEYQPRTLYSFHSQGEEIYYKYGDHTPSRSWLMSQILASSGGYLVTDPPEIASHGGLKDWFIQKLRRPGFTIEIGLGKNPLPVSDLDKIYAKIEEMLVIATLL